MVAFLALGMLLVLVLNPDHGRSPLNLEILFTVVVILRTILGDTSRGYGCGKFYIHVGASLGSGCVNLFGCTYSKDIERFLYIRCGRSWL